MKMHERIQRTIGAGVAALFLCLLLPVQADAQQDATFEDIDADDERIFSIDGRAGIAMPVSDLDEITEPGPALGLGLTLHPSPRVGLRLDGNWAFLNAGEFDADQPFEGPDFELLHYTAGIDLELTDPTTSGFHITVNGGAGGTSLRSDAFTLEGEQNEFDQSYFTTHAGLKLATSVADGVRLYADGQYFWVFGDEADADIFDPIVVDGATFEQFNSIPVTLGLRVSF